MTDRYENIRKALEMGPTPGPWGFTELPRDMQRDGYKFAISRRGIGWRFAQIAHEMNSMANAAYVTACDPDTIRALLAERDALRDAIEQRDIAIDMLARWCVAVSENGAGWDDWDEHYKDAAYRPGPLRSLLDAAIDAAMSKEGK